MLGSMRFALLPLLARALCAVPALTVAATLAGCSSQPPPQSADASPPTSATQLRDTIQAPINKAKGVEGIIMKSHDRQDQQLQKEDNGEASQASQ